MTVTSPERILEDAAKDLDGTVARMQAWLASPDGTELVRSMVRDATRPQPPRRWWHTPPPASSLTEREVALPAHSDVTDPIVLHLCGAPLDDMSERELRVLGAAQERGEMVVGVWDVGRRTLTGPTGRSIVVMDGEDMQHAALVLLAAESVGRGDEWWRE